MPHYIVTVPFESNHQRVALNFFVSEHFYILKIIEDSGELLCALYLSIVDIIRYSKLNRIKNYLLIN